jgi:hypothetical protein
MKTFLEFRSHKFPPYPGEEDRINPGLWGKRLAEYLEGKLKAEGFKTHGVIPEDWGWWNLRAEGECHPVMPRGHGSRRW